MQPFLSGVTLTGVDEKVPVADLMQLADPYPDCEFGVLVSRLGEQRSRRLKWLDRLAAQSDGALNLCLHLCYSRYQQDSWLNRTLAGDWQFVDLLGPTWDLFQRVQLNLRHHVRRVDQPSFVEGLKSALGDRQVILQLDRFDHPLASECLHAGIDTSVLYDLSGGRGVLPNKWPVASSSLDCGFAGGLTPSNLADQLPRIQAATGDGKGIWIDAQSPFRPWNIATARDYLQAAAPWVLA